MADKDSSHERQSNQASIPTAQAMNMINLVQYAEGSIVSRTMVDSGAATVTLFAFDAGQGLSEHSVPFKGIVQILEGRAELTIGGRTLSASAGELVVMPANVPHAVKAHQEFKMLLTMIRARA